MTFEKIFAFPADEELLENLKKTKEKMKEQIAHDYSIVSQAVLQPSHDTEQKLEEFKSNDENNKL